MAINTYISDNNPSGVSLDGTYIFHNGLMLLPSGSELPVGQHAGQVIWIAPSGKLCIYTGTIWKVLTLNG